MSKTPIPWRVQLPDISKLIASSLYQQTFLLPGQRKVQLYFLHCLFCDNLVGVGVRKLDKYIFHHHTLKRGGEQSGANLEKQSECFMVEERLVLSCLATIVQLLPYKPYNRPVLLCLDLLLSSVLIYLIHQFIVMFNVSHPYL